MYIARLLYPIRVLGPGDRIGIWFDGCSRRCLGCSNPELWEFDDKYHVDLDHVLSLIDSIDKHNKIDGFTITGGDPFEQPDALMELLPCLRRVSTDILVYTGFLYSEIKDKFRDILQNVTVIIDGKYVESLNRCEILRGSTNQNIIVLDQNYNDLYSSYLSGNSEIQNFMTSDGLISVGIHRPGYQRQLDDLLKKKGLETHE